MTDTTTKSGKVIEAGKVAGALSAIIGLTVALWGFTLGPAGAWIKAREASDTKHEIALNDLLAQQGGMQDALVELMSAVSSNTEVQASLVSRVEALESRKSSRVAPAIRFALRGHDISDGSAGESVSIKWAFYKLADCGRPIVSLFFENGDARTHRFENVSILNASGSGVIVEPDPNLLQDISYTARIPSDQGVEAGQAYGWVVITYPDCPLVKPVQSPRVPFQILP